MLTQLARYEPVVRLLADVPGSSLLEVGSGSRGLRPFVGRRWAITSCDTDFSDYGARTGGVPDGIERLRASVLDLPLENAAFDVVVAVDLLEHLEPADRPRALQEMARVAARRLVVACPCGDRALEADRRLMRYYHTLRRTPPGWLDEHLAHGFPETDAIVAELDPYGSVRALGNERIGPHLALSVLEATPLAWATSRLLSRALSPAVRAAPAAPAPSRWTLRALRGFDRKPTYRSIVVLDRRATGS